MNEEDYDYVLGDYFLLDREQGGRNAILMGAPGQGKTSLLEYLTYLAARGKDIRGNKREQQACIWRARKHDKYLEFMNMGIGILALPEGSDYQLTKVYNERTEEIQLEDLEDEGIPYMLFKDPEDIVKHLEKGKVICILFPGDQKEETEFYTELSRQLVDRRSRDWVHMVIDEADDIIPPYSTETYKIQTKFITAANDMRKTNINTVFATHSYTNLDYRIRPKTPWHIYKRGAQRMEGESRKLSQTIINQLRKNEAEITFGAFFDPLTFPMPRRSNRLDFKLQTEYRRHVIKLEKEA